MSTGPDGPGPGAGQPAPGGASAPGGAPGAAAPAAPGAGDGAPDRGASTYKDVQGRVNGKNLEQQQEERDRALTDLRVQQLNGSVYVNNFGQSYGQGSSRVWTRRVTPEELDEPFIRTASIDRLAATIGDQPIVVLQGPRGYGRGATLVRTLSRDAASARTLFLAPATDLATFTCAEIPERSVMILEDLPESAAGGLDDFTARRIEGELRARECRLGVTTGRSARFAVGGAGLLVVELDERPDPGAVFRKHLAYWFVGTGTTRDDVMSWPGVAELVRSRLTAGGGLADAQRMATLLFHARDSPATAAARVRAQLTEHAGVNVAQWFRKLPDLKVRSSAISLAVLNGLSREIIGREARVLERIILPSPDAANAAPFTDPLAPDAAMSPEMLEARVVTETQVRDEGPVVVQAMSYREPGYPGQVLRYVWQEHGDARAAIVEWLRYLGASPDLKVRVRAATAAGVLACEAMDYVYNEIIVRWAGAKDPDVRDSAAIALGPPADDRLLKNTTREVIAGWAGPDCRWQLRATAARAYGRTVGLSNPTSALRELARLAEESAGELDVLAAVSNSYLELVLDGTMALSLRVIGEVGRLAADPKRARQAAGRLTLLGLSTLRGAPPGISDPDDRLASWPTLLVLAVADPRLTESVARLWQLSLHDPDIGSLVTTSLDGWAQSAEGDSQLRKSLVAFLGWIAADPRSGTAIARRARLWCGRDGVAPRTGRALLEGQD